MIKSKIDSDMNVNQEHKIDILCRGPNHVVAVKPPSVLCHHTYGSWKKKLRKGEEPEIPMLQRVRDVIDSIDNENQGEESDRDGGERMKRRLNLVHRLDRGASGALLFAFAGGNENVDRGHINTEDPNHDVFVKHSLKGPTAILQEEMSNPTTIKTYVAIVRGEGILRGEDLKQKGWFEVNRPIKDKKGKLHDATTYFNFIAGQRPDNDEDNTIIMKPRICLVLARPQNGRWHQIRRHLNGLSHHILGDGTHGCSKTNKEWREKRNMPRERVFLHLARLKIPQTIFTPNIDCSCPLPLDMIQLLRVYAPEVLRESIPLLESEGITLGVDVKNAMIDLPKMNNFTT